MRLNFLSIPCLQLLNGETVLAAGDERGVGTGAGQSGLVPGPQGSARTLAATPAYCSTITALAPKTAEVKRRPARPCHWTPVKRAATGRSLAPVRLATTRLLDRTRCCQTGV